MEEINGIKVGGLDGVQYIDKLDDSGDKTGAPDFAIAGTCRAISRIDVSPFLIFNFSFHSLTFAHSAHMRTAETDQIFKDVKGNVTISGVVGGNAGSQIEVAIETSAESKDCVVWNPWIGELTLVPSSSFPASTDQP